MIFTEEMYMKMTIGANIKHLRTTKRITQEQLSVAMNVTCAAVSKWERGDTYPDITLLLPLAYYFGVTLDELMGYDREKIQTEIEEAIALYRKHRHEKKGREIIVKAYRDHPDDYWIMYYYMWEIAGGWADNDPATLIKHKDEFLSICDKILDGCTEEHLRLDAWNMRAKILFADGRISEALEIYKTKFTDWFITCGQKTEQLFSKGTDEYYYHVRKNMYELIDFAADKLGRTLFFRPGVSVEKKAENALLYGKMMTDAFEKTGETFFLTLARSFLGRMSNDLCFRGGTDEQVTAVTDKYLSATKKLDALRKKDEPLDRSFDRYYPDNGKREGLLARTMKDLVDYAGGRRASLLNNKDYRAVLDKYR